MKRKIVAMMMCAMLAAGMVSVPTVAEVENLTEKETEALLIDEKETATTGEVYAENTVILSDFAYEAGTLSNEGWLSSFLEMQYNPLSGFTMGLKENKELNQYYRRFGEETMIANNELVVKGGNKNYLQMMVEVNPNHEKVEDILERFVELEQLEMVSQTKEIEVAGKKVLTCTGVFDKEKFLLGVSTDTDNFVLALKVRYETIDARKNMLAGFEKMEASLETDIANVSEDQRSDENESKDLTKGMDLEMPKEFAEAVEITE